MNARSTQALVGFVREAADDDARFDRGRGKGRDQSGEEIVAGIVGARARSSIGTVITFAPAKPGPARWIG